MSELHKQVTQHPRQRCYFCGSEGPIETHHIVPRRHGGEDHEANLVDVCANCHQRLEALYYQRFFDTIADAATVEANVEYDLRAMKRFICDEYKQSRKKRDELEYDICEFYKTDYTLQEAKLIVGDLLDRNLLAQNGEDVTPMVDCDKFGQDVSEIVETTETNQHTTKTERDRTKNAKQVINDLEEEHEHGAPIEQTKQKLLNSEYTGDGTPDELIEKLRLKGEVYEPVEGHLRTT